MKRQKEETLDPEPENNIFKKNNIIIFPLEKIKFKNIASEHFQRI